jgi:hypothetical protein
MKVLAAFNPVFGRSEPCLPKSGYVLKDEYLAQNEYTESLLGADSVRLDSPASLAWAAECERARNSARKVPEPRGEKVFTAAEELRHLNRARLAHLRRPLSYLPTMPRACVLTRRV